MLAFSMGAPQDRPFGLGPWVSTGLAATACLTLAACSLALPSAPGYDAWSWLQWGREAARLELATDGGPAFKPLAVAVAVVVSPFGDAAPALFLVVARAAALAGVLAGAALAYRWSGGSRLAAVGGALAVALCGGSVAVGAGGGAEGATVLLLLLALDRGLAGRAGSALALGAAAALLRPEAWPFLGAYAAWLWPRAPRLRPRVVAGAGTIALCWLLPDLLASGELLRSAERARVPNPGAPALADRPVLASLRSAAALPLWPLGAGGLAAGAAYVLRLGGGSGPASGPSGVPRDVGLAALAGLAWIALVAGMSELGFSGEARYALPGAAVLGVAGAAVLGRPTARRPWPTRARAGGRAIIAGAVALALVVAAASRAEEAVGDVRRSVEAARLAADLGPAVAGAGGRAAILACGRPYVGPFRGPLLAWHLDAPKAFVGFVPRRPGVVFRSRLGPDARPAPDAPAGFRRALRSGRWEVLEACRPGES